jgi:activating signal cointegrator 1
MSALAAISLWQPWASLWLSSAKLHETRHWATRHRGLLLVHAAKKIVLDDHSPRLNDILDGEFGPHWGLELPRGALIGVVNLVAVLPTEILFHGRGDLTEDEEDDLECGNFEDGRFAWKRGVYRRFPEPIPYRGHQSMFSVPYSVVAEQIKAAARAAGDQVKAVLSFPGDPDLELKP